MGLPRDLVLGTAGHIDHGKTALVKMLSGVDTDRLPAEKQRGITIDLGFAALQIGSTRLALVDVPGHERFIRNMLAGATGIDLVMLVVAADDSVMPQTREHLEILRLLGIRAGLIVMTKIDLVDPGWLDLVEEEIRQFVSGSFLESARIVRTSAATGEGLSQLRNALEQLVVEAPSCEEAGSFRMAIDRGFSVSGHGTVVTGSIASGSVAVGDELELQPLQVAVRVRGIHRHDQPVTEAHRGARAAINLTGIHHTESSRGQVLATPGYLLPSRWFSAQFTASPHSRRSLRHRARYKIHLGTGEYAAKLMLFDGNELCSGQQGLGQFLLAEPAVAVHGQPFIVREESPSATLGGGRILQPTARRVRRRDRTTISLISDLNSTDPNVRIQAALTDRGVQPWNPLGLAREVGVPLAGIAAILGELKTHGFLIELAVGSGKTMTVPRDYMRALEERVLKTLSRLHTSRPRQSSLVFRHVASALSDLDNDDLVQFVLTRLRERGLVRFDHDRSIALVSHEPQLSQAERRLKSELLEKISAGGFSPPELSDLSLLAKARSNIVPELLTLLVEEELLVQVTPQLYLSSEAVARLRESVVSHLGDGKSMTMADLRDLLATSRKYAVPIGEYLDKIGITEREGDSRRLGSGAGSSVMAGQAEPGDPRWISTSLSG